jgi:hypothetical protein
MSSDAGGGRDDQRAWINQGKMAGGRTSVVGMDQAWAAGKLTEFVEQIDRLTMERESDPWLGATETTDWLIRVDPVMRGPGYGDYRAPGSTSDDVYDSTYWSRVVRVWALRSIGVLTLGAEARERMKPDSPDLAAEQLHPWVWDAAAPLWFAGNRQEAVNAAVRCVNARLQQKLGRHDLSEAKLAREAFSLDAPAPGRPRRGSSETVSPGPGGAARTGP